MTTHALRALFVKHEDEFLRFELVEPKLSQRPDLHAFILLDRLVPGQSDIVSAAEHDQFWIDVSAEALAAVVTEEQVVELRRCGVSYDSDVDALYCFT